MTKTITILTCLLAVLFSTPLSAQNFCIYVSDAGNFNQPPWQILKFDQNGENGEVFISGNLAWPQDIFFIESENEVLISNLSSNRISKFDATSGGFIGEFATGIGGPTRMKLGTDTLLYVLQWGGNGKVLRYKLDGTFVDEFTETGVSNSIGLDWDEDGNLYVSSYSGDFVKKFSPTGEDLDNFISDNLVGPTNIWFGENGDLFVVDYDGGAVKRFDKDGNYLGVFISGITFGEGVDFFSNGDIAIGSGGASAVKLYDSEGNFIRDLIPAGTLNLLTPNAVVFQEKTTSATNEVVLETMFVTPNIGTQFLIRNQGTNAASLKMEVYNQSGTLVEKLSFSGNSIWNASHLSDGVYFITTKMADDLLGRQKIVIQR